VPRLLNYLILHFGWRRGILGLAALPTLVALPLAYVAFFDRPADGESSSSMSPAAPHAWGLLLNQAIRTPKFWLLGLSTLLIALGVGGCFINIQPLLRDRGFSAVDAGAIASWLGIAIIVGRLGAGFLLDRFWAPIVCAPLLILPALSCLLLMQKDLSSGHALIAVLLLGTASGVEADVIAYLSARYFGLKDYGAIYGVQYAIYGLASGFAPFVFARVFEGTGSYNPILQVAAFSFAAGALLLFGLGAYPTAQTPRPN
jgi:MFS transporter, OFA family, oxalate/formate antiporter